MADALILPGTEMEVFEKYSDPLSRRLDHPGLSDVRKTSFAKGIISDFKRAEHVPPEDRIAVGSGTAGDYIDIEGDPFKVESMVKVKIDEAESDFIPIWYQPKAKFWNEDDDEEADDTGEGQSLEFDEEAVAYKKAWMSFRGGDEVVVMLKDGVPVAVVGFADGVPRVGEDVIQFTVPPGTPESWIRDDTGYHFIPADPFSPNPWNMSATKAQATVATYSWRTSNKFFPKWEDEMPTIPEKAPDGFDYKLLQEAEMVEGRTVQQSNLYTGAPSPYYEVLSGVNWNPENPYGESHPNGYFNVKASFNNYFCKVCAWLVPVGPILYVFYSASYEYEDLSTYYRVYYDRNGSGDGSGPILCGPYTPIILNPPYAIVKEQFEWLTWPPGGGGWDAAEWDIWWSFLYVDIDRFGSPLGDKPFPANWEVDTLAPDATAATRGHGYRTQYWMVMAGVYTPELVEKVKATINNIDPVLANGIGDGGVFSWDWGMGQRQGLWWYGTPDELILQRGLTWWMNYDYSPGRWPIYNYNAPDLRFFTRPHTKEELIAAGMWPRKEA